MTKDELAKDFQGYAAPKPGGMDSAAAHDLAQRLGGTVVEANPIGPVHYEGPQYYIDFGHGAVLNAAAIAANAGGDFSVLAHDTSIVDNNPQVYNSFRQEGGGPSLGTPPGPAILVPGYGAAGHPGGGGPAPGGPPSIPGGGPLGGGWKPPQIPGMPTAPAVVPMPIPGGGVHTPPTYTPMPMFDGPFAPPQSLLDDTGAPRSFRPGGRGKGLLAP